MDIASVLLKSADLLLKVTTSPVAKKIQSIRKYESEIKRFADTVELIGDVLSDVEAKQFQEKSIERAYKRLRNVYLDAEDVLDAIEAHRKKLDLDTRNLNKENQEMMNKANGKRKQLFAHALIKKKVILMKTRRFFSQKIKHAFKMDNAMKEIMKNSDEIATDLYKIKHVFNSEVKGTSTRSEATNLPSIRATGPCVDADNIIGREEDMWKIVDLLLSSPANPEKIPVISIVGIGGMGKTTTAQLLYNDKSWQQSCSFDMKLWVPDSKKFNVESLLKNILKSINPTNTGLDSLAENHLREQLVKEIGGKRFFLVLDDVENENILVWENLESLLNHGNKGDSRILVTTRSRKVADVMGSGSPYDLQGLSEPDAFKLFEKYAFRGGRNEDLVEMGKRCVQKCLGVPLAIKVIGSLLSDENDKGMWDRVWRDTDLAIKDESNQIISILMISYYNLDYTLKQCFSYCALFPKNHKISKQILSSIWRANIRLKNGTDLPEVDCEKNTKTLCDRCLLEEVTYGVKDRYFKMHDLIHDLANNLAGKEMFEEISIGAVDSKKLIIKENVRHVRLTWDARKFKHYKFLSEVKEVKGRQLRTFLQVKHGLSSFIILQSLMKLNLDKLVLDCPVLRLLDLKSSMIKNLTSSIGKLIHLRYLDLSGNPFRTLPDSVVDLINLGHLSLAKCTYLTHLPAEIGKLTNLEVLDISRCDRLKELPMGIVKLIKLKHLRFEGCSELTQLPAGMGALKSLCTMEKFIIDDPKSNGSAQFEELGNLSESIGGNFEIELPNNITLKESFDGETFLLNKKSLRDLKIRWRDNLEDEVPSNHIDILAKLQPPPNLEVFRLSGYQGMMFPPWIPNEGFASILPNLVRLYIVNCGKCQHLPPLSRLPWLKYLELCGLRNLEYIEENVSAASFCPSLENLKLDDLPNLKGWCRGAATVADDDGEHQQFFMLPSFPCLYKLHIRSCPRLTVAPLLLSFVKVYSVNRNAEKETLSPASSSSLESSFKERLPALSSSSVNLFVQVCRNGGEFSLYFDGWFLELFISDWDASGNQSINMVEPFRELSEHLRRLEIRNCSGLKTFPGLQHLTALEILEIIKCCDFTGERDVQLSWKELQSLKILTLKELPKMERLSEGIQFLTSLERLECEDCCEFTGEIDGQVSWKHFQSLKHLTLAKLPKMKSLPEGIQSLTSLERLKCEDCCEFTGEIDGQVSWKHFQSLKHLTLTQLPKMKKLPEGIQFLTSLEHLCIRSCENLLLPEWLEKTFNTRTNKWGYYMFEWVMDSNNARVPRP